MTMMATETGPLTPGEVEDIKRRAALLLQECGWTQGLLRDDGGRLCMIGALATAAGEYGEIAREPVRVWVVAQQLFPGNGDDADYLYGSHDADYLYGSHSLRLMAKWNDRDGRTVDDVIARLKGEASE